MKTFVIGFILLAFVACSTREGLPTKEECSRRAIHLRSAIGCNQPR